MDMEGTEELVGSSNNDATATDILKGKRTKRLRPFSPSAVAAITSSSSSASGDHVSGGGDYGSFSSTTTTYESTVEEEDMANCLILLAQGGDAHTKQPQDQGGKTERGGSQRFAEMATATATSKIGFYIYECKTCNRSFPSFQALGGHRASHKKPKVTAEEKKPPPPLPLPPSPQLINSATYEFEEAGQAHMKITPQISLQLGSNGVVHSSKAKIHGCSICGSEFKSGQALGGHMRRHRASTSTSPQVMGIETSCNAATTTTTTTVEIKPRKILPLDLNLPAPEEDLRDSKFQFTSTQKRLVLSAPSLVGCHY